MNRRPPLVFNTFGTNVVSTFAYAYDALSRRTQRLDTTDSALTTNTFSYNIRSELIGATMGTNTYSYAYDPIGNRTSAEANAQTNIYAANELNQYTALNPASTNPTPFTYDPDGNMTSDGTWSYSWDAENRLIEVQPLVTNLDSTLVQYMYDAQSRRIARREFSWMAFLHDDPTWRYVQGRAFRYDGWNLLHERKPSIVPRTPHHYISQTNLYLTGSDGPVSATYVWGLDLSSTLQGGGGIGGLLMQRHSDTNSPWFSFCDANGNITDLLDEDGTLVARYEYDSYGNTTAQSGSLTKDNSFHFSTKYVDDVTGLCYFGYRFYNNVLGRWVDRDMMGENGGANIYEYVHNIPIVLFDPFGLQSAPYYAPGLGVVVPPEFSSIHSDYRVIHLNDETKYAQYKFWNRVDQFVPQKCECIIKMYIARYEFVRRQDIIGVYVYMPPDTKETLLNKTKDAYIDILLPLYGTYRNVDDMLTLYKNAGMTNLNDWSFHSKILGQSTDLEKKLKYEVYYAWITEPAKSEKECYVPVGKDFDESWSIPYPMDIDARNANQDEFLSWIQWESQAAREIMVYLSE